MALLEIEAGCRSVAQLERICSPVLWSVLEQTVRRRGGPFAAGHALIGVHCQNHSAELADAVAVVRRGKRAQAIVIRLEASGGRWMVTVLQVLGYGGLAMRASGRERRGSGRDPADGRPVAPYRHRRSVVPTRSRPSLLSTTSCPVERPNSPPAARWPDGPGSAARWRWGPQGTDLGAGWVLRCGRLGRRGSS